MRGDRVEIVVDVGDGTKTYELTATKAGRRVEVTSARGMIDVSEVTRTREVVRSGRFMASRVVAVIEHPAEANPALERPRRRRAKDQPSLL
jgi:F0F1-type ATP synthase gamma subunit